MRRSRASTAGISQRPHLPPSAFSGTRSLAAGGRAFAPGGATPAEHAAFVSVLAGDT